jgi:NDP-sugar pyrophosphorylase family protein
LIFDSHLEQLTAAIRSYIPEIENTYEWIRNPFLHNQTAQNLTDIEEEQLIVLANDGSLKAVLYEKNMEEFWISVANEKRYEQIAEVALRYLLPYYLPF